jgi:glycosyltransferase involved in cell wall biosynthesis
MKACMVAYTYYETDNRVRRYAETLAKRGDDVSVFSLRSKDQGTFGKLNGVKIYRIQERIIDEKSKFSYLKKLLLFFLRSSKILTLKHLKEPFDLIHVHSVPDFQVFSALIPKLFGAKVILDVHDLVPEFFRSKFSKNESNFFFNSLKFIEKLSSTFSDHVIISNHLWLNVITSRSLPARKCTAILNYPDPSLFYKRDVTLNNEKVILLYPGTLNWHQGLDIAIKAFHLIQDKVPNTEFHIYGDGPSKNELAMLIEKLKIKNKVFLKGLVSLDEIVPIMSNSNIGIIPKRNDPFGGEAFSTKTLEFMSLGVPILISKTKIDSYYFKDSIVTFFEPGCEKHLSAKMLEIINNPKLRKQQADNALKFIKGNNWDAKKYLYLDIVDSLKNIGSIKKLRQL